MRRFRLPPVAQLGTLIAAIALVVKVLELGNVKLPTWGVMVGLLVGGGLVLACLSNIIGVGSHDEDTALEARRATERAEKAGGVPLSTPEARGGGASTVDLAGVVHLEAGPDYEMEDVAGKDIRRWRSPDGSGNMYIGEFRLGRMGPKA